MIIIVTTLNFKDIIDLPKWKPLSPELQSGSSSVDGLVSDLRNNEDKHPFIYHNVVTTILNAYNTKNNEWIPLASPTLGANFSSSFFMPAQGPRGTIAAGATTTTLTLTTALPAAVGVNQLANRGDGRGFKVRVIGNAAGSSGKTEERIIITNTGETTTPTLVLDSPLSFTPILGDTYEFLSGRVFMLGATAVAGSWKYYDVLTNSFSAALSVVNLTISGDNILVGLDELLVPYDRNPGDGFFGNLTATASAAATLTGQAAGGDAGVVANQYRNFKIRIVQDIAIPTAVGQRRNITSHTAGASPVYTVPAWTVQPSATATYVIENNGDRIIAWSQTLTNTNTYTISTNTWDTNVTFAVRPTTAGSGLMAHQSFSIEPDTASPPNARHSFIFFFRAGNTNTLDLFDISGAATGTWTAGITYGNQNIIFGTASSSTQDPATMQGRYMYIFAPLVTNTFPRRFHRFDMKNRVLEPMTTLNMIFSSAETAPSKHMAYAIFIDGGTKLSFIIHLAPLSPQNAVFGLPITR